MDFKIEKIKKIEHLGVTEGLDLVSVFLPPQKLYCSTLYSRCATQS